MAEDQTKGQRLNFQKPQLSSLIPGGGGQTQQTQQTQQQDTSGLQATGGIFLPGISNNKELQSNNTLPNVGYAGAIQNGTIKTNIDLPGITSKPTTISGIDPHEAVEGMQRFNEEEEKRVKSEYGKLVKRGVKQLVGNVQKRGNANLSKEGILEKLARIGQVNGADYNAMQQYIDENEAQTNAYNKKVNDAFSQWEKRNMDMDIMKQYEGETVTKLLSRGDAKGATYKLIKGLSENITMIPEMVVTMVAPEVGLPLIATDVYIQESQSTYEDLIENGATYEQAQNGATLVGLANASIELLLERFLGGVQRAGASTLRRMFLKNMQKEVVRNVTKKGFMEILGRGILKQGKTSGVEGLEEILQQLVSNAFIKTVNPDKDLSEGMVESFDQAFWQSFFFPLGGGSESVISDVQSNREVEKNADLEALDYVMQGEERKAQRMQQAKQNMKDKFLNPTMDNGYTPSKEQAEQRAREKEENEQYEEELRLKQNKEVSIENSMIDDVLNDEEDSRYQKKEISATDESEDSSSLADQSPTGRVRISPENSSEITKSLNEIKNNLDDLKADTFLQQIKKSISGNEKNSNYVVNKINGMNYVLRVSDHHANSYQFDNSKQRKRNTSIVIKLAQKSKFKKNKNVDLAEFVYDPANMTTEKMQGIIDGLQNWIQTGEYTDTNYDSKNQSTRKRGDTKYQLKYEEKGYKPGVANKNEKSISGKEGVNLRSKLNKQTIKQLAEKYGIKVEVIEGMIEIIENRVKKGEAYGKYIDQVLTLSEQIKESTAPHELLHAIFDMIDPETKAYLISQVMQSEGWSAKQAEEWLADSFSNFYRTGKIEGAPKSTWGKIKMFFKRVRSFINGLGKWRTQLEEIFTDIIESEGIEDLQGRIDQSKSLNEAKAKMKQRFMEYSKNAENMQKKAKKSEAKLQEAEDQTQSKAFKKRFGDSKVVDENGNPLVVYHGTPYGGFTVFKNTNIGSIGDAGYFGRGWYFTNDKALAKDYSDEAFIDQEERTNEPGAYGNVEIKEVYLKIENPYVVSEKDVEYEMGSLEKLLGTNNPSESTEKLKDEGYDGVIYEFNSGTKEYTVFEPNQIKSATDNIGTFDANNDDIRYQEAEDVDPNIQSPNEMVHKRGQLMVIEKFISEEQKKKALDVSKDILVQDGSHRDGHPYMWMHTNKYNSMMIPNFENTKDNRYKEFSDKGIVVSFFTNNEDMSKSYADHRSVLANTKRFKNIEEFNDKFKDTSDRHISEISGNPIKGDTFYEITIDENGLMPFAEEAGSVPEYVLHKKYDELIKYKSVDEMYRGVMPRDVKEGLSDSEKIQAVKKYAKDNFMGDEWGDSRYDGVEIIRDGNDVIFRLRQDKELGRYKTEKQALANARSLVNKQGQYHYKGIIQNMHNPLVVDKKIYGWTTPNWNRLGNAYDFLEKTDKEQLTKLVDAIDDVYNRQVKLGKEWNKLSKRSEKLRDAMTEELNDNRMDNFNAKANKDENEIARTNHRESEIWDKREKFDSIIEKLELALHKYYDLTDTAKEVMEIYLNQYNIKEWRSLYNDYMKLIDKYKEFYSLDGGEKFEAFAKKNYGVNDATLSLLHGIEGVTSDNGEKILKDKWMQTNDFVFYALRKGGYDGVMFGRIHDYGGDNRESKWGGNVLVSFNSNQFKSWDNADPTDSEFISYQKMDDEYEDAVNRGDTERAKEILREYAKEKGYLPPEDYKGKGAWVAPSASVDRKDFRNLDAIREQVEESYDTNLYAIANGISLAPDDYFGPMGSRYYMYNDQTGMESYYAIKKAIDSIQTQLRERGEVVRMPEIEVYRAVPDYKKKIASLQKDLDLFTFDKDGNPRVSDVSKLSKESQEDYARYKDQQEREVIDDADQLLYDTLRGAQNISDEWTVKEGMLQSGGEWVSPSLSYAKQHGGNRFDGNYKIIKEKVPADELRWDGNDIREWGFDDGREYVTKPVKNSRKNIEITYDRKLYKPKYDENGNKISGWEVGEEYLIPLSKRFNDKNPDTKYQTVYHGSQADFDRFDSSHMGEGEGNQAHGWGHYVAVDPNTARKYADLKHYNYEVEINGKTITNPEDLWSVPYFERELYRNIFQRFAMHDYGTFEEDLQDVIDRQRKDYEEVIQHYEKLLENPEKPLVGFEDVNMDSITLERKTQLEGYREALEKLDELTPDDVKVRKSGKIRHFYEVDIPDPGVADTPTGWNYIEETDKPDKVFIDAVVEKIPYDRGWEEVFFEEEARDIKKKGNIKEILRTRLEHAETYKDAIANMADMYGGPERGGYEEVSKFLQSLGYDGIHYFGGRDGEAYVIFDDNDLEITNHEKYQIAEYDYDENGRRTNLKFGEDNSEFDPSIFDRSREDQIDADKENEKSSPFYNAWVRYNAQNYKDDQLTLEEFINEIIKRGDKEQEIYDQKMRDIGEAQNDPKMLDLQLRAVKLMEEEGQVGKKFGKNVSKEVRDRQQAEVEKKREQLVKDIFDWMYPGLRFEDATYDDQKMADQKEAEWEMLGKEDIESKLKYFKKDKNGNREAKDIKVENPDIKLEKILSSGKWEEIFTPVDRVIEWKTPQGQKGRIDRLKEPAKYKRFFEKIYDPKTKTKVEVKDVTKEVRALEKYRADEEAEKARKKKERQEAFAKKQQEEYKKLVRMKAFQKLIDMQWLERYPFLSEDEVKTRYGFTDEEWKKITEQDEIKLPKKRGDRAISDFNKAVDSQVKALIEGLTWQNNMKQREAEKNLGEIGEIDIDVLLGRDEEKGQKEVEEFEKIAEDKQPEDKNKKAQELTNKWKTDVQEMFRKAEEKRNERYANKEEKKIDEVKSVEEAKTLTKDSRWKRTKKFWKDTTIQDLIQPISSRIEKISPRIYLEMMRFEQRIAIKQNTRMKQVEDFVKKMAEIRSKNKKDYLNITLHLLNGNVGTANQMLEKYGTNIPRQVLDEIWADAEDVGYTMNYEGFYYPRKVKDVQEFLDRFAKTENKDVQGEIDKVVRKAEEKAKKRGEEFTEQQKADLINQLLMDGEVEGISLGSGHMKKRKVDSITKNMLEFYEDPVDSLLQYINGMTEAVEKARFLGQGKKGEIRSLGEFIAEEGITGYDADELKKLLLARFNYAPMGEMMSKLKVSANIIHLGSPSSALSQLADVSFSIIENGLGNIVQGLAKKYNLDLDALGINNRGEELKTQGKNETGWEKIQRFTFKWTGFNMMDQFGKKLLIVSTLNKLIRYAKNNDPQLRKDLSRRFDDPKMIDGVIEDLKVGKMSENVNLFLFTKLADVQPLTRTQMTRTYLQAGNWRVLYAFKTFGIKQLDYIIQKSRRELQTKPTAKALWSIVTMLGIIMLCGAGDDELKDFSMGRKYSSWIWRMIEGNDWSASQLSDRFWDNFLKLFGFTKYSIYQARTQGIKSAIEDIFFSLPGLDMFTYPLQDIQNAMSEDGLDFSQASSWQLIPIVGKYGYWWVGAGQTKQQKSLEKEKKKSTTSGGSSRSTRTTRSRTTRSSRKSR